MARLLSEFNACSLEVKQLFKLYISDNSENSDTEAVVGRYANAGINLRYTRNSKNIGMMANFENVLGQAEGRYLWLFGDDDQILFSNSLEIICNILREKTPDYLILLEEEVAKFGKSIIFNNVIEYLRHAEILNPDAIRCQTWITSNIIRKEIFDFEFASTMKHTEYMHMYGIFNGLKPDSGSVILYNQPLVRPHAVIGHREESFLNYFQLARKWAEFYVFLDDRFAAPRLRDFSRRWIDAGG